MLVRTVNDTLSPTRSSILTAPFAMVVARPFFMVRCSSKRRISCSESPAHCNSPEKTCQLFGERVTFSSVVRTVASPSGRTLRLFASLFTRVTASAFRVCTGSPFEQPISRAAIRRLMMKAKRVVYNLRNPNFSIIGSSQSTNTECCTTIATMNRYRPKVVSRPTSRSPPSAVESYKSYMCMTPAHPT